MSAEPDANAITFTETKALQGRAKRVCVERDACKPCFTSHEPNRQPVERLASGVFIRAELPKSVAFSLALADPVYVLEKGVVVREGPSGSLRDDAALQERLPTV